MEFQDLRQNWPPLDDSNSTNSKDNNSIKKKINSNSVKSNNNNKNSENEKKEQDIDEEEEDQEAANQIRKPLFCIHKEESCNSSDCETVQECRDATFKTHCYTMFRETNKNGVGTNDDGSGNFTIRRDESKQSNVGKVEIRLAGCWSGGHECEPPEYLNEKYKYKHNHDEDRTHFEYKIPESLMDKSVQGACIGYSKSADDKGYLAANNLTFCCCSSNECNRDLFISSERNPFEMLLMELNPKSSNRTGSRPFSSASQHVNQNKSNPNYTYNNNNNNMYPNNRPNNSNGTSFLTRGELNAVIFTSFIFILLIFMFVFMYVLYKKKLFFRKNKSNNNGTTSNNNGNLPSVLYSKVNNSDFEANNLNGNSSLNNGLVTVKVNIDNGNLIDDPGTSTNANRVGVGNIASINVNNPHVKILSANETNETKETMLSDYLSLNKLLLNEELKSSTQPLLGKAPVYQASIVAPNIKVMPNEVIFSQTRGNAKMPVAPQQQSTINYRELINELRELEELERDKQILDEYDESPVGDEPFDSTSLPSRLKCHDVTLLEKISTGQFSTVWKAKSASTPSGAEPEFAVKVFNGSQKTSWVNEKEIYNLMSTTNDFILKYYGTDILEKKAADFEGKGPSATSPLATPSFLFSSNEYWIMTEFHPCGSLYDYLKVNFLTWPQIVRISYCILEGLAFLHAENLEIGKKFAIAHRDLKSKNILVKRDGFTCCIADFGLALKLNNSNKLSSAEIRSKVGTRRYMSPELIEGAIAFTKETFLRIDVYACALVLWEIISRASFYEPKCEYKLPFEEEVGQNPTLEEMKEIVVDKCQRPIIKQEWIKHYQMSLIIQTIEECWDIDLDARISSECAASRIRKIYKNITT